MATRASVLLVDDEQNIMRTVKICLESAGFSVTAFTDSIKAADALREQRFDIGFYDLKMSPIDGLELLKETKKISPETTVILMTAHGSVETAVEAMKKGAFDYLQKPFEFDDLKRFAEKVFEHHSLKSEVTMLREELRRHRGTGEIVTRSEIVRSVLEMAAKIAPSAISVLLEGESGTGKELLARHIHQLSDRAQSSFVQVNCAALAENLLESELFGHVKGAFTGAVKDREGRFDYANGGTIFLDEITEVSPAVQAKLLRVLQSKEFERVGESATRKVDVRVITATNKNLEQLVEEEKFREDLFYRLNAVRLKLPPLRERVEDIPLLVQHFLEKQGRGHIELGTDALSAITKYPWKGNVRELENIIERAVLLAKGETIQMIHLPEEFETFLKTGHQAQSLEEIERQHIVKVLRFAKDLDEAASILAIDPTTLWRKRKKYNL